MHTFNYWSGNAAFSGRVKPLRVASLCLKLVKSILLMEDLPQELLTESPQKILTDLFTDEDK